MKSTSRYTRSAFENHITAAWPAMASVISFEPRGAGLTVTTYDVHAIHTVEHIALRAGLSVQTLSECPGVHGTKQTIELLGFAPVSRTRAVLRETAHFALVLALLAGTVACSAPPTPGRWTVNFTCHTGEAAREVQTISVDASSAFEATVDAEPLVQRTCNTIYRVNYSFGRAELQQVAK